MSRPSGLSLYQTSTCPYCRRVRDAMKRLDLDVEARDINENPSRRDELVKATGRHTVPCLRIEGENGAVRWMHESADIITYLEERFGS